MYGQLRHSTTGSAEGITFLKQRVKQIQNKYKDIKMSIESYFKQQPRETISSSDSDDTPLLDLVPNDLVPKSLKRRSSSMSACPSKRPRPSSTSLIFPSSTSYDPILSYDSENLNPQNFMVSPPPRISRLQRQDAASSQHVLPQRTQLTLTPFVKKK